jgi:DNA-binding PadR family transcriptional regulator
MPLRATDNPLVLPLLGLLLEQPLHQYGLLAALRERYRHLRVRTSSVYTLVNSLREAGWIEPADAGDAGTPARFRVSEAGVAEFRGRVVADLEDTDPAAGFRFVTALAYVGILDRKTATVTLDRRAGALRRRAEELEHAVDTAGGPAVHMIEVDFFASQLRHDIAWLERFVARIGDDGYEWPVDAATP